MEEGQVVMVTEHRVFDNGSRKGQIVIRVSMYNHGRKERFGVDE